MAVKTTTLTLPLLITLSSITLSLAQQSVLSLPFYGFDHQTIVASVVGADSTATTLALNCYYPPNYQDSNEQIDCGLFPRQTLTYGPSTYHMDMSDPGVSGFTGTQDCSSTSICMESAGGEGANFPGSSTTTYEKDAIDTLGVTVTAGMEKLSAASTRTSPASAEASATGSASSVGRTTLTGGAEQTSSETASRCAARRTRGTSTEAGAAATGKGVAEGLGVAAAVVGALGVLL